ncbi:5'-3'-deoxyribonucleotidase [Bacillus sp. JCM 19041]|uniref:5' nucleotidase, NT5C type n=1 Tax=Bacillus sp. JCM 19041 TaxID=1460637 RepID=UPI0018D14819
MMKKRIAIDMDEVMADFNKKHLTLFNADYGEQLTIEDLHGKKLRELRPKLENEIRSYMKDPTYFRDLDIMQDSQEVIKELSESYEVYIATAAMHFPTSFTAKYEWLQEHFPFLDDQHFVFCGDKSVIKADYLIDDNLWQLERFTGEGILYTAPHNIHATGYTRVNNWQDVRAYFLEK